MKIQQTSSLLLSEALLQNCRTLQVTLCKMGLSRELMKYFSLFFCQDHDNGVRSVLKKVAELELPFVSLQSVKELNCKLGIREWYMDPSLDALLMDCTASLDLLYMQGATKDGEEDTLELRFEYSDSGTWQWIILYTKQAFLLSSCLKKMVSEQMTKAAKEGQEMEMKMPESTINSKKSSIQQKQAGGGAKLELMEEEEGKKHA
ncbi:sorting nexin-31 isoform 3-T16 [Amazona ochrocephala]